MPGPKRKIELPNAKIEYIQGQPFLKLKEAAKLAGIHPVILEMGKRLLARPDVEGGVFPLKGPEMQKNADAIEQQFVWGLRKIAKALSAIPLRVKSVREEERLVFFYAVSGGGAKPKGVV